jgi:ankyrin repeat protein
VDFLIQNSPNRSGETLFILAVHQNKIDVIQLMLVLGVKNINQLTSNKDFNALLIAANSDHWEIVNTILEHGKALGDPLISLQLNHANIYGYTAAHYAAKSGKLDVLEFLQVAGADLNLQALNGHTPLSLATASGRDEVATYLQNLGYTVEPQQQAEIQNLAGLSLLFQAVTKNKCDQVKKMLDQKIEDINQVTANGLNALQLAAVYGHWEIVDMIFKHGELTGDPHNYLQLDHKNSYGYTIAHYAAKDGKLEVLRNLKAAGADLNIEALDRYTPLSLALYYNHTDVLREIFSIADKTTDESVSNQSDDSENTGAMLKSMTTHFLEKSSKNTGSYLPQRDLKERAVQENELLSHYKKK